MLFQCLELLYDHKSYWSQNNLIVSSPIEVDENWNDLKQANEIHNTKHKINSLSTMCCNTTPSFTRDLGLVVVKYDIIHAYSKRSCGKQSV
jgi:hypothetical protein